MKGVQISKILPVPENFYDIKKTCNLIATPATIYPYTVALYVAGIASFASFFLYYSQESNYFKETVVQSTHELGGGFVCTPLQPDSYFGLSFNHEECSKAVRPPSSETVSITTWAANPGPMDYYYEYIPFPPASNVALRAFDDFSILDGLTSEEMFELPVFKGLKDASGCDKNLPQHWYLSTGGLGRSQVTFQQYVNTNGNDAVQITCQISKDTAIEMFSILVKNLGDICAFTKQNPPYSCARQVPPPFLQRASLAYANSALLYGALSTFFARMLYRSAEAGKDVELSSNEGNP